MRDGARSGSGPERFVQVLATAGNGCFIYIMSGVTMLASHSRAMLRSLQGEPYLVKARYGRPA